MEINNNTNNRLHAFENVENGHEDACDNSLSFEEALSELEDIVAKLEKGDLRLDDSLKLFQRGVALSRYCSGYLDQVERKICVILENPDGTITEKPVQSLDE